MLCVLHWQAEGATGSSEKTREPEMQKPDPSEGTRNASTDTPREVKDSRSSSLKRERKDRKRADKGSAAGESGKFTFITGHDSPFNQFYEAKFTVDEVTFTCAEQYMMYQKACECLFLQTMPAINLCIICIACMYG